MPYGAGRPKCGSPDYMMPETQVQVCLLSNTSNRQLELLSDELGAQTAARQGIHSCNSRSATVSSPSYPNRVRISLSSGRKYDTSVARHSSIEFAKSLNRPWNPCPGLYHVSIGAPVRGLVGGLSASKLKVSGSISHSSFPVPCPSSSWIAFFMK